MSRITDREFLIELKGDLERFDIFPEKLDRLQLVIDRLEPDRLIAAVRAYEDHMLRALEDE